MTNDPSSRLTSPRRKSRSRLQHLEARRVRNLRSRSRVQ